MTVLVYKQAESDDIVVIRSEHIAAARPMKDNSGRTTLIMVSGSLMQIDEDWKQIFHDVFGLPPSMWT